MTSLNLIRLTFTLSEERANDSPALVNVFPIRNADDQVVGAVNFFRHNTSKRVPGLIA